MVFHIVTNHANVAEYPRAAPNIQNAVVLIHVALKDLYVVVQTIVVSGEPLAVDFSSVVALVPTVMVECVEKIVEGPSDGGIYFSS